MNQAIYTHDEINGENFDFMVEKGYINIKFNVLGYWSDVITLRVRRDFKSSNAEWSASVSHSSGGRDTKVIISDIEAERNFAKAILAAADLADELMTRVPEFEQKFQSRIQEFLEESNRQKELLQKKFDEDSMMSESDIQKITDKLEKFDSVSVFTYPRGSDYGVEVMVSVTRPLRAGQRTVYRINNNRVSKEGIKDYFSSKSNRSYIVR